MIGCHMKNRNLLITIILGVLTLAGCTTTAYDHYKEGEEKFGNKDYRGAMNAYTKAIELRSNDPRLSSDDNVWIAKYYWKRGKVKSWLDDYQGWLEDANRAIALDSHEADYFYSRGQAKVGLKDYWGALADLEAAAWLAPYKEKFTTGEGGRDEMKSYLEKSMKEIYAQSYPYYESGLKKYAAEDYQGAIADFSRALEISPKFTDCYWMRGEAKRSIGLKDMQGSLADANKAIELSVRGGSHEYFASRGKTRAELKDYAGAVSDFDKAIQMAEKVPEYYFERGNAKLRLSDRQGALSDYELAIWLRVNPRGPRFGDSELDDANMIYVRKVDEFLTKLEMDEHPKAYARYQSGNEKFQRKNYQGALADYDAAIALSPDFADAYWKRGQVRSWLDDRAGWVADVKKAIERNRFKGIYFYDLSVANDDLGIKLDLLKSAAKFDSSYIAVIEETKRNAEQAKKLAAERARAEWEAAYLAELKAKGYASFEEYDKALHAEASRNTHSGACVKITNVLTYTNTCNRTVTVGVKASGCTYAGRTITLGPKESFTAQAGCNVQLGSEF